MKDREFCKRLKKAREYAGLTQAELEVAANLPFGVIAHYESGSRTPGLANIKAILSGLDCDANYLLGGD